MTRLISILSTLLLTACSVPTPTPTGQAPFKRSPQTLVLASEVDWQALNPARGAQSPRAGTLWGDRRGTGPTGFLFRPVDGFRSPPHIHNVTYRGVVIHGLVHNDEPQANDMWMPATSFWTQPRGHVHITAARGEDTLAYIEIDRGPYLVLPVARAFETEARPINVHATNLVWVELPDFPPDAVSPSLAYLWGDPQDNRASGTLVKLPAGFVGSIRNHGPALHAVVIKGRPQLGEPGSTAAKVLEPGSYLSTRGRTALPITCGPEAESILYLRVEGRFDLRAATAHPR